MFYKTSAYKDISKPLKCLYRHRDTYTPDSMGISQDSSLAVRNRSRK